MDIKSLLKSDGTKFIIKNVIIAILIIIVLLIGLLIWLRHYTQHGVEVEVPSVIGLYEEEALPLIEATGLKYEVMDSTYSNDVPLGAIVEQNPQANSKAKKNRIVYVTVNSNSRRKVPVPDLHDLSCRQAEATLRSLGIQVNEDIEYIPSEYKDLVLDVKKDGQSIQAGDRIEVGSRVTLVVGFGQGTEMVSVPNVCGMTLNEARAVLLSSRLTVGAAHYDEPQEEGVEQYVYQQTPENGNQLLEGSGVTLHLSSDKTKAVVTDNHGSEEDFF